MKFPKPTVLGYIISRTQYVFWVRDITEKNKYDVAWHSPVIKTANWMSASSPAGTQR